MIAWTLLTGAIIGAVWVGIMMGNRQRRRAELPPDVVGELERRLDRLELVEQRLAEVEERLDFTERLLANQAARPRLERPTDDPPSPPDR